MFCGYNVNHIDISPRFSGLLFGISNGIGQTLAILAPLLVQFIVYEEVSALVLEFHLINEICDCDLKEVY